MREEAVFLSDGNVYVSNARVILNGTTYATANLTSVAKRMTPANTGCATLLIVFGGLTLLIALASFAARDDASAGIGTLFLALILIGAGILWARSLKPTFHVYLATAAAERPGLSSTDEALIDRVVGAISNALIQRG